MTRNFKRTVNEVDLAWLKEQRERNDGAYDDALTALDKALYPAPEFPHPPPSPDETQVTPLNSRWEITRARAAVRAGWRGRLERFVWGLVGPLFAEQQAFNSLLVDHINRNITPERETAKSIETTIAVLREQVERLITFQSVLLQYLQRITPFVNSKGHEFHGLAVRMFEDCQLDVVSLVRTQQGLAAAVQGLSNELLKNVESFGARVTRYDGRFDSVNGAVAAVQQEAATLRRELARSSGTSGQIPGTRHEGHEGHVTQSTLAGDQPLHAWKYPAFEAAFRGSETDIGERVASYLPIFDGAREVVDLGCGRGEFLELLKKKGVTARGVDLNLEMVEQCKARGLDVAHGDALSYLRGLPDTSIGGIFAAQVVEHLTPDYLIALLDEAQRTLRPGAPIVLETINVACWYAFFQSYVRDITHARPLHPDTLKYLVIASGFSSVEVQFRAPVAEANRLQKAPEIVWRSTGDDREALAAFAKVMDNNIHLLNSLMFTSLDYAVIGRRA